MPDYRGTFRRSIFGSSADAGSRRSKTFYKTRQIEVGRSAFMSICLLEMDRVPSQTFCKPFHIDRFYITRETIQILSNDHGIRWSGQLRSCIYGHLDPTLYHLAASLEPAFARPNEANALFTQHIAVAFFFHLITSYGEALGAGLAQGGLAPRNLRLAREAIDGNLKVR